MKRVKGHQKTSLDPFLRNCCVGFTVNPTLAAFYAASSHSSGAGSLSAGNGSETGGWVIDEVPQSEYTADVKASDAESFVRGL